MYPSVVKSVRVTSAKRVGKEMKPDKQIKGDMHQRHAPRAHGRPCKSAHGNPA